jgi:L-threonylcarbamoyladenylate synthase
MALSVSDAQAFERCMAAGGLALFPADTVYGLACDPHSQWAIQRIALLKDRPASKACAVMFFDRAIAFDTLSELGPRTRAACDALLPGAVTLLLPNPRHRFPLACGDDPDTLGLRVPLLPTAAAALTRVSWPVLQTSANHSGEPAPRRLDAVSAEIAGACELTLDGGELPGTASTVIDLRVYEDSAEWAVLRRGAVSAADIAAILGD